VRRRAWIVTLPLVTVVVGCLGWAGFAPIVVSSHEQAFDIPKGTFARRRAGDLVEILPDRIRLTLGLNDVLVIHNHDDVPQVFGPTVMLPGLTFSLPFERAASYQFVCSAHASGQLTIDVEPEPVTPWARIHWRLRDWVEKGEK
jgi:hypothetical protein